MSAASIERQRQRLLRHVVPREGQTLEQAHEEALALKRFQHMTTPQVLAEASRYFNRSDLKMKEQRGRFYLYVDAPQFDKNGRLNGKSLVTLGSGPTRAEAFLIARFRAEGTEREKKHKAELERQTELTDAQVAQIERELAEAKP